MPGPKTMVEYYSCNDFALLDLEQSFYEFKQFFEKNPDEYFNDPSNIIKKMSQLTLDPEHQKRKRDKENYKLLKPEREIPLDDPRRKHAKLFMDGFNSCDHKILSDIMEENCVEECMVVCSCKGETNPYGPMYFEVHGRDACCIFWDTCQKAMPDTVLNIHEAVLHVLPDQSSCLVCKYTWQATKVFDIDILDRHKQARVVLQEDRSPSKHSSAMNTPVHNLHQSSHSLTSGETDIGVSMDAADDMSKTSQGKSNLERYTEQTMATSVKLFSEFDTHIEEGRTLNAVVTSAEMTYNPNSYTAEHPIIDVGSFELGNTNTKAQIQKVYGVLNLYSRPDSKIYKMEYLYINEGHKDAYAGKK